jgi:hypothetical protein
MSQQKNVTEFVVLLMRRGCCCVCVCVCIYLILSYVVYVNRRVPQHHCSNTSNDLAIWKPPKSVILGAGEVCYPFSHPPRPLSCFTSHL